MSFTGEHDSERFFVALFAPPQLEHKFFITGIAREVEPADTLNEHNLSLFQSFDEVSDDRFALCFLNPSLRCCSQTAQLRATLRAAHRLSVIASIVRVFVFFPTARAHREHTHGRLQAIVWQGANDGEARATLDAINERIGKAAISLFLQLASAVVAKSQIRRYQRETIVFCFAGQDAKIHIRCQWQPCSLQAFHMGCGGSGVADCFNKRLKMIRGTLRADAYAVVAVQYRSRETMPTGKIIDERTEPHALHRAGYMDCQMLNHCRHNKNVALNFTFEGPGDLGAFNKPDSISSYPATGTTIGEPAPSR